MELIHGTAELFRETGDVSPDLGKRLGVRVLIHEYKRTPGFDAELRQTHFRAIPIFHSFELGGAEKLAVQFIGPGMIWTTQYPGRSAAFDNGRGAMAAHI